MKKIFTIFYLVLATILCTSILPTAVKAAGSSAPVQVSVVGSSSASANGSSTITLKTSSFWYVCPTPPYWRTTETCDGGSANTGKEYINDARVDIAVSGSGNTLGNTQTDAQGAYVRSGADGSATFTIASTIAESKTVTVEDATTSSVTISFTAVASTTTKPKTTTSAAAPTAAETTPPEAPKTTTIEVDGQTITSTTEDIKVTENQPLVLKGTTVPNGVVKLYIFSTPREATVTADAQGVWSYEVTGLEPGSHHVEAEVTDPAGNKTSARATLAQFTVVEAVAVKAAPVAASKATPLWMWIVAGLVAISLVAGGVWWFFIRSKGKKGLSSDTPVPTDDSPSDPTLPAEKP